MVFVDKLSLFTGSLHFKAFSEGRILKGSLYTDDLYSEVAFNTG